MAEVPVPELRVKPRVISLFPLTSDYKIAHMALRLLGEARLHEFWLKELRESQKRYLRAKECFMVKYPNHDDNWAQVKFKVAYNTRENSSQCITFEISYALSIPLKMHNGILNIPDDVQLDMGREDYNPDVTVNANQLHVYAETTLMAGGSKDANRHLALEMQRISDEELCEIWKTVVKEREYCVVIAQTKIIVCQDPRKMPLQQFQVHLPTRSIEYQLVFRFTEHLVLLNGDQMPTPSVIRVQNTMLD